MLTTVVFDVGETLLDETRLWAGWARWLEVPAFTLHGVLGGLAARGRDHREFLPLLRPGSDFATERAAVDAAGRWPFCEEQDLYPDVVDCLQALRSAGWRVVVGGNQPGHVQQLVTELELPVDLVTSSGELGVEKPDPEFFRRLAGRAGAAPEQCVHVGDRVDNDVVAARAAGLTAVHLRRGPWGVLHADDPALTGVPQLDGLAELPGLLDELRTTRPVPDDATRG